MNARVIYKHRIMLAVHNPPFPTLVLVVWETNSPRPPGKSVGMLGRLDEYNPCNFGRYDYNKNVRKTCDSL